MLDTSNYANMIATKNFSLTIKHVGMLSQMEKITGKNASELARAAIENLFDKLSTEAEQPTTNQPA